MKRLALIAALAVSALGAPTTASAHGPDFQIAGFQYLYVTLFENIGVAGYVNVPLAPPVHIGGAASNNGGARSSVDDQLGTLSNQDRVPHTFTECTAACDTAVGSSAGARFDIALPAGAVVDFLEGADPLAAGDYTFMCTVHPYMRGEFQIT